MNTSAITISVKPVRSGWTLECETLLEVQVFKSGGAAERSAVQLAAALIRSGRSARVIIHDLDGLVAGSLEVGLNGVYRPLWLPTVH